MKDFGFRRSGYCSGTGSVTVAALNGSWTRRWSFEVEHGVERGVAKSRDTARRSARATVLGVGAWVSFFIVCFGLRGLYAFGHRCYLDAPVRLRWFGWLRFGFLFLGFGFLLQL